MKGYKYYGITSATFGAGTQNKRCVNFRSSAYFNLAGKQFKLIFLCK